MEQDRIELMKNLQSKLRSIRAILGLSRVEFGKMIGVTVQTISNLENFKTPMSGPQYIAICAVIDHYTSGNESILNVFKSLLVSTDMQVVNDDSFVMGWIKLSKNKK